MSQPAPEKIQTILAAALKLPPHRRDAFLEQAAAHDPAMLEEVRQLIALYPQAEGFLARPLAEILTARAEDAALGSLFKSRYRLIERVAAGSFATVYYAADEVLQDRQVTVKVIDRLPDETLLETALKAEVTALSRLHHPQVVGITDMGVTPAGRPFVVLTYVPGETLRAVMKRGRMAPDRARAILRGIGRALAAAHKAGVWHLDLKPENVIVTDAGRPEELVTLIDFGIARLKEISGVGLRAQTPAYHAPEQMVSPGAHTDLYLLSLLAFELFTGALPEPQRPVEAQLPRALGGRTRQTIAAGLRADPAARPGSVEELVEGICDSRNSDGRLSPALALAGLLGLGLVAGGAAWFATRNSPRPASYDLPVAFANAQERERRPAFSADGRHIYYEVGMPNGVDIYRKAIDGGAPVPVATGPSNEAWPTVSPDERTLIFNRTAGGHSWVVRKSLPGGPEENIADGLVFQGGTFSPGSDRAILAVNAPARAGRLEVFDMSSRQREPMEFQGLSGCTPKHPRLAPAGGWLAFACEWALGSDDLFQVAVGRDLRPQGAVQRLTTARERIDALDWAPDGQSVLFLAGPLGSGVIKRIRATAGALAEVVPIPADRVRYLSIPRRDFKIAFAKDLSDSSIWEWRPGGEGESRPVVATSYEEEYPRHSPDGRHFTVTSLRTGVPEIWLYRADGTQGRRLFVMPDSESGICVWRPGRNDEMVCSNNTRQGDRRVFRGDVSSGALVPILDGFTVASFSRDGRWVYLLERHGNVRRMHRMAYPSLGERRLMPEGAYYGEESLDGQWFYYTRQNSSEGVWKVGLNRGAPERVIRSLRRRDSFALGGSGIFYVAAEPATQLMRLWLQPYDGGRRKGPLYSYSGDFGWGMSLSPDEQTLVYSRVDSSNSDILLVKHFR